MGKSDLRVKPSMENYFLGEQYKCQEICITEGFWNADRVVAENDNGSRPVLDWALTLLDLEKASSILDIGCGPSQKMFRYFGGYPHIHVTGLDSREATELARKFNPSGEYHECDLDSDESIARVSSLMRKKFDVVFCLDVIEHVLYPEKMLNLIKAHSHPGTKIFITTLERDLSKGAGALLKGSAKAEHVREWNSFEFSEFVTAMGFIVEKFKITPMRYEQHCQTLLCSCKG